MKRLIIVLSPTHNTMALIKKTIAPSGQGTPALTSHEDLLHKKSMRLYFFINRR